MTLSSEEVKHIALLARIGLTDEDVETYQKDLSAVFDFFKQLEKVDTTNVEPIRHITGSVDVTREDRVESFGDIGKQGILANVPATKDKFIKVRSVF